MPHPLTRWKGKLGYEIWSTLKHPHQASNCWKMFEILVHLPLTSVKIHFSIRICGPLEWSLQDFWGHVRYTIVNHATRVRMVTEDRSGSSGGMQHCPADCCYDSHKQDRNQYADKESIALRRMFHISPEISLKKSSALPSLNCRSPSEWTMAGCGPALQILICKE